MKKIFLIAICVSIYFISAGQNYEIDTYNGQTVTTCSGIFYDSGGGSGFYAANESYSVTFCPSTAGTKIDLDFSNFDVGPGSELEVFDGPNNTFNSFGVFSTPGFSPVGMGVAATPTNSSGCLTVEWTSGTSTNLGWQAQVSCIVPCQTVLATLLGSDPLVSPEGYIDICPGDTVSFIGGGIYPENNLVYAQGNNTSSFVWNYGNGVIDSSSTNLGLAHYDSIAGYFVNLTVYDSMGCESTNVLAIRVRVSTEPSFSGTMIADPVICDGEVALLDGEVQTELFEVSAELSLAGTTFLPDGSGASYTTSLVFDAFAPGQLLTNVSDFLSMCAVMEHSYLGDLDITLECPDGTTVILKSYPGCGSTYLGVPIDVDANLSPGVGWEYCWSPSPTYGTMNAECGSYSTMPAGSYASETSMASFVGCPLNGAWTIEVTDNLLSDNGYIFEWGINFNPAILPTNFNYEPQIVNHDWSAPVSVVVADSGQNLTVAPGVGMYAYTYSVTDDFGCVYDTTLDLEVLPNYMVNFPPDTIICSDATLALDASNNGQNVGAEYVWFWDGTGTDTISTADNYLVDKPGFYWVDIPNIAQGCGYTDSILVEYNEMELDLGGNISGICSTSPVTLDATTPLLTYNNVSYIWSTGAITPTITVYSSGTYTVSVARGACIETDIIEVQFDEPLNVELGDDVWICPDSLITIDAGYSGQNYLWSTGMMSQAIEVSNPGTYFLTVSNACGTYTDDIEILAMTAPVVDLGTDAFICSGQVLNMNAEYSGPGPASSYLWSTGQTTPGVAVSAQGTYSVTVTNQCGSVSDEIYLTIENPLTIDLGNNQVICSGETITLDAGYSDLDYFWSTGETTQTIQVNSPDSYGVEVTNSCGTFSDYITVSLDEINVELGPDTILCPGGTIEINAMNPGSNFSWSNGASTQSILVNQAGTYAVTATSANNCVDTDDIEVTLFDGEINLGDILGVCEGSSIILDAGFPGSVYEWSTGELTQQIEVSVAGTYSVTVSHFCGDMYDDVNITINPLPVVDFGVDTIYIASYQSATLDAGNPGASYLWSSGQTSQSITSNQAGWYSVTVTDANGCEGVGEIYVFVWPVGINSPELEKSINIFPNPANSFLHIQSEDEYIRKIEFYNALGELIQQIEEKSKLLKINLSNYSEGIYFVRITFQQGDILIKPVSVVK
jgi:hypothetical protein